MREAYIYDCLRTPRGRGKKDGSLHEIKPAYLLRTVLQALQKRHQLETEWIDDTIIGCATPTGEQGGNIAKTGVLIADWNNVVSGMQLNRFDASGLEAVNLAAMKIRSGWEDLIVAGGIESMSRVPMGSDRGALLFDPAINAKVRYVPLGVSADLMATLHGFTRQQLDEYAFLSQQRASEAIRNGYFQSSLVPVYDGSGLLVAQQDEHPRADTTLERLAQLPPAFEAEGRMGYDVVAQLKYPYIERIEHLHTAGNSSGVVDGAAVVLVGSRDMGKKMGLRPRARIVSAAVCGDEPTMMLGAAVPAIEKAMKKAGMKTQDIDLWEFNEAFAAPVLHFQQAFDLPLDRFNVNGGAIALGHPLGATGAMLVGILLDELERRDLKTGVVALCAAGGMGVATVIERC